MKPPSGPRIGWTSSVVLTVSAVVAAAAIGDDASQGSPAPPEARAFLAEHCLDCHRGADAEAGLDLARVPLRFPAAGDAVDEAAPGLERWARIYDRVAAGEMPPQDAPPVSDETRKSFLSAVEKWLVTHQRRVDAEVGRVRGRRLTNLQLERTLHDLLGVDIPLADRMPDEPRTAGFTTVAAGQAMSHFQLEQHLSVVDAALDEALRRVATDEDRETRMLSAEQLVRRRPNSRTREPELIENRAVTWSSGLVFYGRLPATTARRSGWRRIVIRAAALKSPPDRGVWCTVRSGACISSSPLLSWIGAFEATETPQEFTFEAWLPAGEMLEIRPGDATLKRARFNGGQVGTGEGGPQNVPGVAVEWIKMETNHRGPTDAEIRQQLFAGVPLRRRTPDAANSASAPAGGDRDREPSGREPNGRKGRGQGKGGQGKGGQGKGGQPPRAKAAAESASWHLASSDPERDVERLLTAFARRAFRRPVTAEEAAPYVALARQALKDGGDLANAFRAGCRGLLCSPRFLYLQEGSGPLDDWAVASRLSYFLWSTMPDGELFGLAEAGELRDPEILAAQVERMLDAPRGRRFVQDLASQWLDLSLIDFTEPDPKLYPGFDPIVQQSMLDESHAFLQTLMDEDLDVRQLIDSEFTFLNSRLARYYGIGGVSGAALRRVALRPEDHRGGLLTQGAILKVTANGTTTSPVIRGVWISDRLLGVTSPPPPEGIPAIEPDVRGAKTIREMLAKHQADASCASCHVHIDPPGFALENFDPSGRWRSNYLRLQGGKRSRGAAVDASSKLPDGRTFQDLPQFQQLVASRPRPLARNVAEKLLTYGTGGAIRFADRQEVEQVVSAAAKNEHYGFRSLVREVVRSRLFLTK